MLGGKSQLTANNNKNKNSWTQKTATAISQGNQINEYIVWH